MKKATEKIKARALRSEGFSIGQIAHQLNVSKSSVSLWVRDIELSTEQLRKLNSHTDKAQRLAVKTLSENAKNLREKWQHHGREQAKKEEWLHAFATALFWGEGTKTKNSVIVTNTDPELLKTFMIFLRHYFPQEARKAKLSCHCYAESPEEVSEIEDYWLSTLEIDREMLQKSQVNQLPISSKGVRKGKHPFGCCRLTVHSTKLVQHLFGAIQEYAKFDRDSWLSPVYK